MADSQPHILTSLDEESFERLFRMYYSGLVGYAKKYVKDEAQAEEVVQDMFVKMWDKRNELSISGSPKSYLFRAVHNQCLNLIKHQKVREAHKSYVEFHEADNQVDHTDTMEVMDLKSQLLEGIALLPAQCAKIFRMNRFEGLKYREIAEQLGISPKTVEVQMGKALRRLRDHLKDHLVLIHIIFWIFFNR